MSCPVANIFAPSEAEVAKLLADLRHPDLSFSALAARHNTTPDALALWLTTPAIAAQLESTDSVVCYRARLIAAEHLPAAMNTCLTILDHFNAKHARRDNKAAEPADPNPEIQERKELQRQREFECARKAASTLVRLTRLKPTPDPTWDPKPKATPAPAPSPKPEIPTPQSLQDAALAAAIQLAATIDPTRDPMEVLEDLAKDEPISAPPEPAKRAAQHAPLPKPRVPLFPSKQLWRTNIPGAAMARAP